MWVEITFNFKVLVFILPKGPIFQTKTGGQIAHDGG